MQILDDNLGVAVGLEPPQEAAPMAAVPMAVEEDQEEAFQIQVDEDDVQDLVGTSEVKGYTGKSEWLSWLEY